MTNVNSSCYNFVITMKQKIRPIGNSAAVILPKSLLEEGDVRIGTSVNITYQKDMGGYFIEIPKKKTQQPTGKLSQEFQGWLNSFIKEDAALLDELSGR